MNNLLYDLLSRIPYDQPMQQPMHRGVSQNGFYKTEQWGYIEAKLLNDKILSDYKTVDSIGKNLMRLTFGSLWAKELVEYLKDSFTKRMEGLLFITEHQVFFEGRHYHMCCSNNKITKVEKTGHGIRIAFGKKEECFFVKNPEVVFRRLIQYVDRKSLLQGNTYYDYLKSEGQDGDAELYERIYFSLMKFKADIMVDKSEDTQTRFNKILQLVLLDHPMIYYVNPKKTRAKLEEHVMRMKFSYVYNQKQCEAINEVLLHRVARILSEAEEHCGNDETQLVKWLYTYLVQNVSYAEAELESEEDEVQCRIHSILGVFLDRNAVCDGIARACKLLLNELGIDNWVVRQDLKEGMKYTHEWNMIMQDRNALHLDATWERNIYDVKKQVQYDYFMLTEEEMKEKHKGYKKE